MKTTIEISDPLLRDAKRLPIATGTTLRALVEQGLRQGRPRAPGERSIQTPGRKLQGQGAYPEFADAEWDKIREAIYEGRGG